MEPVEQAKPLSVFELTRAIEERISEDGLLLNVSVVGEMLDYKEHPSSGHAYFTLTDKEAPTSQSKKAILKCTFFKYYNKNLDFKPRSGMEVLVTGAISVYYQGGQYNLNAKNIIEIGKGKLWLQIQQLRQKFLNEGIINPAKRRALPTIPRKIGIVTGMGTAALKDILKQVHDRYPHVELLIAPAIVQGEEAPASIVEAINEISKPQWGCELLIVGRGGGSMEDLMAFNDESVCRAIAAAPIPVISAVGHQIDHPVSDDVADLAAATPTDAAKLALPVISEKMDELEMIGRHLDQIISHKFTIFSERLKRIEARPLFQNPYLLLEEYYRVLDERETSLRESIGNIISVSKMKFLSLTSIDSAMEKVMTANAHRFNSITEKFTAFSPLATLKRGYSVVFQNKKIMNSVHKLDKNTPLEIQFSDGMVRADNFKII